MCEGIVYTYHPNCQHVTKNNCGVRKIYCHTTFVSGHETLTHQCQPRAGHIRCRRNHPRCCCCRREVHQIFAAVELAFGRHDFGIVVALMEAKRCVAVGVVKRNAAAAEAVAALDAAGIVCWPCCCLAVMLLC